MSNVSVSTFTPNTGAVSLAKTLHQLGVEVIFGIVGIPVVEVAEACIAEEIRFIGCRNEQTASYAAGAYGYLSGKPGVCLVVSGPGVVHALSGLYNAQANCWPLLLIGGSCESYQVGKGAFQELDQVAACQPYTKHSIRISSLNSIPEVTKRAYLAAIKGRPGSSYLDFPADFIRGKVTETESSVPSVLPSIPKAQAASEDIFKAISLILKSKNPLLIIGKGAAYAKAEKNIEEFVDITGIPFLTSPMGKGVLSDKHSFCVSAARSQALKKADLVICLGVRLNWMFQFGKSLNPDAKLIQVDISPQAFHDNRDSDVALVGDASLVLDQLITGIRPQISNFSSPSTWLSQLQDIGLNNLKKLTVMMNSPNLPMSHYTAILHVQKSLEKYFPSGDYVLVSEGARTMDVTRQVVPSQFPRRRLDAGTLGVMGIGLGYAIAAQLYYPSKRVVAILGDSAAGFSAMDIETAVRNSLPIIIVVINNGGIYHGLDTLEDVNKIPSFALTPGTQYDALAKLVPGQSQGWTVRDPAQLTKAMNSALSSTQLSIINVLIDPRPANEGLYWLPKDSKL